MESPAIVENPDGPIYIAVHHCEDEDSCKSSEGPIDEIVVFDYEKESQVTRFITMVDFMVNMMNLWFLLDPVFGFLALVSFVGYKGVQHCQLGMILIYLVYQYAMVVSKGVMIYMTIDNGNYEPLTFLGIATTIQLWVLYHVNKFYNKMNLLPSSQIYV